MIIIQHNILPSFPNKTTHYFYKLYIIAKKSLFTRHTCTTQLKALEPVNDRMRVISSG